MNRVMVMVLAISMSYISFGQTLQRKGSLGARIVEMESEKGILISEVIPNSTASSIGILKGDVVKTLNGKNVNKKSDFLARIALWRDGDDLTIVVERAKRELVITGKVRPKPTEVPLVGNVQYGAIRYEDGFLRSIINKPNDIDKPPVIFYLQGFGCGSQDHYFRMSATRLFVEAFVKNNFAVMRMEKPGVGDSNNSKPCNEIGYHEELKAFKNGLLALKNRSDLDTNNIFLFGHSLGGITAAALAAETKVKGIVNYGSVYIPWYDYLLRVVKEQALIRGHAVQQINKDYEARKPMLYEYMVNKKKPSELAKNKKWDRLMRSGLPHWDGKYILERDPSFMQEINDINVEEALIKANTQVLAIHGEFDLHAIDSQWARKTIATVNKHNSGSGKYVLLPGTEHGFTLVPSMKENLNLMYSGGFTNKFREDNFNFKLVNIVSTWINEIKSKV